MLRPGIVCASVSAFARGVIAAFLALLLISPAVAQTLDLTVGGVSYFRYGVGWAGHLQWGAAGGWSRALGTTAGFGSPAPDCAYIDGANKLFCRSIVTTEFGNPSTWGLRAANGTPDAPLPLLRCDKIGNIWAQGYDNAGQLDAAAGSTGRSGQLEWVAAEDLTPHARGGMEVWSITIAGDTERRPYRWTDDKGRETLLGKGYETGAHQPCVGPELLADADRSNLNVGIPDDGRIMSFRQLTHDSFGFDLGVDPTTGRLVFYRLNGDGVRRPVFYIERGTSEVGSMGGFRFAPYTLSTVGPTSLYDAFGVLQVCSGGNLESDFVYVRNMTGGGQPAYCDGSMWRRVRDGTPVS